MAISDEYRCDPMAIYETWPYELLYDANAVLDYVYGLREAARARAEAKAAANQSVGRRSRRFR